MKQLHPRAVWLFFLNPYSLFLGLVFLIFISMTLFWVSPDTGTSTVLDIGIIIIALVLLYIWARLTYHFYRYELTGNALKKEHGIIWKKYVSIPYDRVQNVDIYRGIVARLLGLSDLHVQTAGGITVGSYGAFAEGRLPGLAKEEAERLREELIQRVQKARGQGL